MKTGCLMVLMILATLSVHARELTMREKLTLSTLERTLEVKDYLQTHINEDDLTWRQWGEFRLLLKSCSPVVSSRKKILAAPDDLGDQSQKLHVLYDGCQEGVLSLTRLYTEINP